MYLRVLVMAGGRQACDLDESCMMQAGLGCVMQVKVLLCSYARAPLRQSGLLRRSDAGTGWRTLESADPARRDVPQLHALLAVPEEPGTRHEYPCQAPRGFRCDRHHGASAVRRLRRADGIPALPERTGAEAGHHRVD